MGDSSYITFLSVISLLVVVASAVAATFAWRSGRRGVRTAAGLALLVFGLVCLLTSAGTLSSGVGCSFIALLGLALLIAAYLKESAVDP
jgi:hypothetical protein